jgi:hypothetical protein
LDHIADGQLTKPNISGIRIATSLKTSDVVTILLLAADPKANRPSERALQQLGNFQSDGRAATQKVSSSF